MCSNRVFSTDASVTDKFCCRLFPRSRRRHAYSAAVTARRAPHRRWHYPMRPADQTAGEDHSMVRGQGCTTPFTIRCVWARPCSSARRQGLPKSETRNVRYHSRVQRTSCSQFQSLWDTEEFTIIILSSSVYHLRPTTSTFRYKDKFRPTTTESRGDRSWHEDANDGYDGDDNFSVLSKLAILWGRM